MASYRKPAASNKQLKSPLFANDINNSDAKFKGRGAVNGGVVIPNRIFVGGICPKATTDDLAALFRKYGSVTMVKIVADQNGSSKGYGFVTFEKADDVSRLQCDAENLYINNKQLNIAPAIMKYPPNIGRYPDSIVMPLPPNLYFTNGLPYQYSEGAPVYPNSSYTPQVAVLPAVSDAAYYSTAPYHGTALFYPLSPSTPQIVVGSHQPYSSYQPMHSSNSNYVYSSPASQTASPPSSTCKTSSLNAPTNNMNATDMHVSQGTPIMTSMPPNMTSLPPPVPYPISHPPQYYNGTVLPHFTSDMYYNMVPGTCYPMMTVNGQDTYVPYYEVGEPCSANIPSECHLICAQETSIDAPTTYSISVPGPPSYPHADVVSGGKESSPPAPGNGPHSNSESAKAHVPLGPPPVTAAASDHVPAEHPYSVAAENNPNNGSNSSSSSNNNHSHSHNASHHNNNSGGANSAAGSVTALAQQPPLPPPPQQQMQPPHADYNSSSAFIHRSTAIIYPNAPMPQPNLYFNSAVYMSEATSASLVGPCPYSNKLSEHYVSDHLPKRDAKHTPKKFNGAGGNGNAALANSAGGVGGAGANGGASANGGAGDSHHHQQPQQYVNGNNGGGGGGSGGAMNGNHSAMKDAPPNIPKFPFLVNNNYPGYVNRNMKEKDYKTAGAGGMVGGGGPKGADGKPAPRIPRHNAIGGGPPPKPRIFHNQNQYSGAGGPPPRAHRFERNGHLMPNVPYSRAQGPIISRQNSYDQQQPSPYDFPSNHHHHYHPHHHQGHPSGYIKPMGYEGHHPRRYHPGNNNGGGYRGNKYDRSNGSSHHDSVSYQKNHNTTDEPRPPRKYNHQPEETGALAPPNTTAIPTATTASSSTTTNEHTQPEPSSTPPSGVGCGGNVPSQPALPQAQPQTQQQPPVLQQPEPPLQKQPPPPSQQQLCAEMQKLAV